MKSCVMKWNDTGEKYWTTDMFLILHSKALVDNDSFKTQLAAQVWFWPILQVLKVLWGSSMNSDL